MIYGISQTSMKRLPVTRQKINPPVEDGSGFFYGYFVVGASLLIMSAMWGGYYAFGVFFKPVLNEFGWTRAMTAGAFSLASIMNGLLTIAMGGLTDKYGPRMVMTVCGLLLGSGFILMSQINDVFRLYLFYGIFVGAGMSGSFIPLMSTVARWFFKRRGLMTGIVAAGSGIGALIGPPVASRLISIYGWRISYAILGGITLLMVVLSAQLIKRDPKQVGQVPYGENPMEEGGGNLKSEGFSLREVIRVPQFWIFFATGFCYGYCVFAVMVHITPLAIESGISAVRAANILATIGGVSILGKVLLGRAGDIIGNRRTLILGFILMSIALICLAPAKMAWMLFLMTGIFGFAFGSIAVSHSPLLAELVGLRSHGLIFGVFGISVACGGAMGPLLTGYLFDVTNSYQMAFLLCAVISLTGILFAAFLRTEKK
jgi:MFS transporter, OFA family, oxalate/formate antiporter